MTTSPDKRPGDAIEPSTEAKKPHVERPDHFAKGIAPIKPEFIVQATSIAPSYDDDEAEGGDRDGGQKPKADKKRKRGQNKNRDLRQQVKEVRLCSTLIDPENPRECQFGGDKCRNVHNIEEYLAGKPEDVEGVCPVFKALGYCPCGLKCRWLGSHYNKETNRLVKDLEQMERAKKDNFEVNKIKPENKSMLQKKKYDFSHSDEVIKYIDTLVQNEENILKAKEAKDAKDAEEKDDKKDEENASAQEQTKSNMASYVEATYKVGEKKKLYLKNAKIVSPLTTVGNLPYRRLMKTLGADVTYSEMALTVPLLQATNSEWALPKAHISEYPGFGVQIATSKHWAAAKSAEVIYKETTHVSELNLNCGCPIDLLYRQGQGSALMDQPARMLRILKAMNALSGDIPVTVKMRTGTRDNKNTAKALIDRVLRENDVAAITLHGRSRQQRYTREADWAYIGEVGKTVEEWNHRKEDNKDTTDTQPTWFVGNGDVYTHEDWHNAVNTPGIDSVMVARGALIKPWIFEEVDSQQYLDKSATERLEMLRTFSNYAIEHWGSDEYGVGLARRFMCEFLSFTHRYIPIGILERLPPKINERPPKWKGRNELETLLGSGDYKDWIKITEMFLGKAGDGFNFTPKHKSNAYES
ncbi:tRNA-dihydrouridine synthase 3 [Suhomyces tanzawaensis NRRL Y-17324]|uniref:tRNA-dihydrouridine(47) synthase [NAD(P)(+)] n=1 Tax=Suhomyces tanzawaensis NRRL Y-17324 TaxID=984487 RepID=A0A1E4SJT2_9ASCO|nr:tRNA-dihydrouridine synthase 3 [Suhomyces tanzawaensis NRRL Y-17324]ODV79759.1 tRNA-dihydrouridine synthase 3 [Suhomyces tanzawaensis NRRL Y-17324]